MNIVLSTDNNFVQHCSVVIASVLHNNKDVHIYILTDGLSATNISLIENLVSKYKGMLDFINIGTDVIKRFPMPEGISHISIATYYRLFVASLLPESVHKIIYLDCDIVCRGSLVELYETNIDEYAIGAVYQDDPVLLHDDEYNRLELNPENGYFNAGVLLINLDYWREHNIEDKLLDYIKHNYARILYHDQDVLNAVLNKQTKEIECKYNMLVTFFMNYVYKFTTSRAILQRKHILKEYARNPVIVHYVGRIKPWHWECSHPYKSDYYLYLSLTPFAGWKPTPCFSLNSIKERLRNTVPFKFLPFYNKDSRCII